MMLRTKGVFTQGKSFSSLFFGPDQNSKGVVPFHMAVLSRVLRIDTKNTTSATVVQ